MKTKLYTVYFVEKAHKTEFLHEVKIEAPNSKAACAAVKKWYYEKTRKNAFRICTNMKAEYMVWYDERDKHIVHTTPVEVNWEVEE